MIRSLVIFSILACAHLLDQAVLRGQGYNPEILFGMLAGCVACARSAK